MKNLLVNQRIQLNSQASASAAVFFAAAFWGVYWIPLRYLESKGIVGALPVVLLNLPAALPLIFILGVRRRIGIVFRGPSLWIGLCMGLGIALYSIGVLYSSVARATLLFYLTPVWATLIEVIFLKERVGAKRYWALFLGLLGALLLLSGHSKVPLNGSDLLASLSGLFWAIGASLLKVQSNRLEQTQEKTSKVNAIYETACCQFLFTGLTAGIIGYASGAIAPITGTQLIEVSPILLLVSLGGLLPMMLIILWAQTILSAGRVGLLMMSEIIVAVISANLLLPEESLGLAEWIGAVLVIGAATLEVLTQKEDTTAA